MHSWEVSHEQPPPPAGPPLDTLSVVGGHLHPETGLHANLTTLLDLTRYIYQRDLPHPVSQGQLWGVPIIFSGAFGSLCFDASSLHMQQSAWQPPPPSLPSLIVLGLPRPFRGERLYAHRAGTGLLAREIIIRVQRILLAAGEDREPAHMEVLRLASSMTRASWGMNGVICLSCLSVGRVRCTVLSCLC